MKGTEETAVNDFIRPRWDSDGLRSVGLQPINLDGKLEDIFDYVPRYRQDAHVLAVFTLIDLYGMNRVRHNPDDDLSEKVACVTQWLRNSFGDDFGSFYHPHLSVHEVEAWLLADGICLGRRLGINIDPDRYAESHNLSDPPSKRIDRMFKNRRHGDGYHKRNDGIPLFRCLTFDLVYNTCRYFREFYDALRLVGRAALPQ